MAAAGRMLQERVGNEFHVKKDQTKRSVGRVLFRQGFFFALSNMAAFAHFFQKQTPFEVCRLRTGFFFWVTVSKNSPKRKRKHCL
jgi:hypothetical protein